MMPDFPVQWPATTCKPGALAYWPESRGFSLDFRILVKKGAKLFITTTVQHMGNGKISNFEVLSRRTIDTILSLSGCAV